MFLEQEAQASRDGVPEQLLGIAEPWRVPLGIEQVRRVLGTWSNQSVAMPQATKMVMSRDFSFGHWIGGK